MTMPPPSPPVVSLKDDWPCFDPRRSLRARMAMMCAAAALVCAGTGTFVANRILRSAWENQVGAGLEAMAFGIADSVQRGVYERHQSLQLQARALTILENADLDQQRRLLEAMVDAVPEFAWVGLTDATGKIVAASQRLRENRDASHETWYRGAGSRPFVGTLEEAADLTQASATESTDPGVLFLALQTRDSADRVTGVIVGALRASIAENAAYGVIPEALRRDYVGVTIYDSNLQPVYDAATAGWTHPPSAPPASLGQARRGFGEEITADGNRYLTGFVRSRGIREFQGFQMIVAIRQPSDIALAPTMIVARRLYGLCAGLTVVFGILGWLAAAPISHELRRIAATAGRIGSGDLLAIMPSPGGRDELARACAAVRELIEKLRGDGRR